MVLCVASVLSGGTVDTALAAPTAPTAATTTATTAAVMSQPMTPRAAHSAADTASLARIELTDGWYSLPAQLDAHLSALLRQGAFRVGTKLRIAGATVYYF